MSSSSQRPNADSHPANPLRPLVAPSSRPVQARGIRHVIFVVSGKGGVGKSSVAVNLAVALAAGGARTGILDVDLHGPSVPGLLGLDARLQPKDEEILAPVRYNDMLSVVSMDSLLDNRDDAIIWRGPKKTGAIRQFISGVAWGPLDYLVIDSPPGTGDEHLTVLHTLPSALCLLVTTPQAVALADVRKAISFLRKIEAPMLGLVENMSGLSCPHCGGQIDLFATGGGEELAKKEGIPFLGAIPIDPLLIAAAQAGKPATELPESSPARQAFIALAGKMPPASGGKGRTF